MELDCLFVSSRLLITSVIDLESTHGNSFVLSEPDLAWPETKVSSAGVVHRTPQQKLPLQTWGEKQREVNPINASTQ